MLSHHATLPRV